MELPENKELVVTPEAIKYAKIIAAPIVDIEQRKRAYASIVALDSLADYLVTQNIDVNISKNLFKIAPLNEEFEISDLYYNGWTLDVRIVFDNDFMSIPKSHFENEILADFYVGIKLNSDFSKAELVGFVSKENINSSLPSGRYYLIGADTLSPIEELFNLLNFESQKEVIIDNHDAFENNYLAYIDREIDDNSKKTFIQHLVNCAECRSDLVEFYDFESIVGNMSAKSEFFDDHTLDIIGAQAVDSEQYKGKEEIVEIVDTAEEPVFENVESLDNEDILGELFSHSTNDLLVTSKNPVNVNSVEIEEEEPGAILEEVDEVPEIINEPTMVEEVGLTDVKQDNTDLDVLQEDTTVEANDFEFNLDSDEDMDILSFDDEDDDNSSSLIEENVEEIDAPQEVEEAPSEKDIVVEAPVAKVASGIEEIDAFVQDQDTEELIIEEDASSIDSFCEEESEEKVESQVEEIDAFVQGQDTEELIIEEETPSDEEDIITDDDLDEIFGTQENPENQSIDDVVDIVEDEPEESLIGDIEIESSEEDVSIEAESDVFEEKLEENENFNFLDDADDIFAELNEQDEIESSLIGDDGENVSDFLSDLSKTLDDTVAEYNSSSEEESLLVEQEKSVESDLQTFEEYNKSDEVGEMPNSEADDFSEFIDSGNEMKTESEPQNFENSIQLSNEHMISEEDDDEGELIVLDEEDDDGELTIIGDEVESTSQEEDMESDFEEIPFAVKEDHSQENHQNVYAQDNSSINEDDLGSVPVAPAAQSSNKKKMVIVSSVILGCLLLASAFGSLIYNKSKKTTDVVSEQPKGPLETMLPDSIKESISDDIDLPIMSGENTPPVDLQLASGAVASAPKDMNKVLTNAFDKEPGAVTITKIAWEVPSYIAASQLFAKYLQITGKNLQLNLKNDLMNVTEFNYSDAVKVRINIGKDNKIKKLSVLTSSGSKQVDDVVLQSIKETLKYINVPKLPDSDELGQANPALVKLSKTNVYPLTLVINF